MEPIRVLTPMVRAWRCHQRGDCCRGHAVRVDAVELGRIRKALLQRHDARAAWLDEARLEQDDGWRFLPTQAGACVFLDAHRCGLRKDDPAAAYPAVCQRFPYLSILTPDRHLVGLTLACPTALRLFADERTFDPVTEGDGEPPTDFVSWVAQPDRDYTLVDGRATDAGTFWATHWDWLARFRARPETDPAARLQAFAEDVTGLPRPKAVTLSESQKAGVVDDALLDALEVAAGFRARALPFLFAAHFGERYDDPVPSPPDEDALLLRYLLHRLLVPPGYVARADLRFQLLTLFAIVLRWRAARARGQTPIDAARVCDKMVVHSSNLGAVFADDNDRMWRALAALVG